MEFPAYTFFLHDGSRIEVHADPASVKTLASGLGALTWSLSSEADEVAAALEGHPQCALCSSQHVRLEIDVFLGRQFRTHQRRAR